MYRDETQGRSELLRLLVKPIAESFIAVAIVGLQDDLSLLQQLCLTNCINMIFAHLTEDVTLSKHQLETRETSASERGPCTIYCHLEKIFIPPDR